MKSVMFHNPIKNGGSMKKGMLVLVLVVGMGISFGTLVFAEEMQEMGGAPEQGQGMMGGRGKGGPMMGMMHKDSVVATSDGGVVVLSGPRLLKYDSDLNLVKEVELPKGKRPGPASDAPAETQTPEAETAPAAEATT